MSEMGPRSGRSHRFLQEDKILIEKICDYKLSSSQLVPAKKHLRENLRKISVNKKTVKTNKLKKKKLIKIQKNKENKENTRKTRKKHIKNKKKQETKQKRGI